jgi:hypothetical protein
MLPVGIATAVLTFSNGRQNPMTIICNNCARGPLDGRALFRDKGALFHNGNSLKGKGPLFCAACAPAKIKRAIADCVRLDPRTKELAA